VNARRAEELSTSSPSTTTKSTACSSADSTRSKLDGDHVDQLARILTCYDKAIPDHGYFFTGSKHDTWTSGGAGHETPNEFTSDDLVAVTFLSVKVPPRAASLLLRDRKEEFNNLLVAVGDDVDLHTLDAVPEDGWRLMEALRNLPDVGPTIASKLFARKRPRLRPIYDSVVERYLSADKYQWDEVRAVLREHPELVKTLEEALAAVDSQPSTSPCG